MKLEIHITSLRKHLMGNKNYLFSGKIAAIYWIISKHSWFQRFVVYIHIATQMKWTVSTHLNTVFQCTNCEAKIITTPRLEYAWTLWHCFGSVLTMDRNMNSCHSEISAENVRKKHKILNANIVRYKWPEVLLSSLKTRQITANSEDFIWFSPDAIPKAALNPIQNYIWQTGPINRKSTKG